MLSARFREAALEVAFLSPLDEAPLELLRTGRTLQCCFVDRDRFTQTACPVMQLTKPHGRWHVSWIASERTLEPYARIIVLSEHERGNAGAEPDARIVGQHRRRFREGRQGVAKPAILESGGAVLRQHIRVPRLRTLSLGAYRDREHHN